MLTRETLRGIWAGIPTAFQEDGSLDEERLRENVDRMCSIAIDGIYSTGGSGEFYALELADFKRVVDVFVGGARKAGKPVQIGCGWSNVEGMIARMKYAKQAGADGVQVTFPYWYGVNPKEVLPFFRALATACPDMPMVHYNATAGRLLLHGNDYRLLAEEVPTLIGTKIIAGSVAEWVDLTHHAPQLAHLNAGEMNLPLAMMHGAVGTCSALIFVAPALIFDLYRYSLAGDWAKTVPITRRIADFFRDVLGPLFAEGYCDAALDKALAEASGLLLGFGAPRAPYRGLTPEHFRAMRQKMLDSYPDFIYRSA